MKPSTLVIALVLAGILYFVAFDKPASRDTGAGKGSPKGTGKAQAGGWLADGATDLLGLQDIMNPPADYVNTVSPTNPVGGASSDVPTFLRAANADPGTAPELGTTPSTAGGYSTDPSSSMLGYA